MARYRIIRPEFWWDETMDELSDTEALAYIALWNHVDDDGRHNDNPRELEMQIPRTSFRGLWPELLDTFDGFGLIVRYEVGGKRYFYIRTWFRHQYINRPTLSAIPGPPGGDQIKAHRESSQKSVVPLNEGVPYEDIYLLWNSTMGKYSPNVKYDPKDLHLTLIRSTWMSFAERQKLEWWKAYFMKISNSKFLTGQVKEFVATLRWVLIPDNMAKITSGQYHDEDKGKKAARRFANDEGTD